MIVREPHQSFTFQRHQEPGARLIYDMRFFSRQGYNWDGMMYPTIRLSDMNVREITSDELSKLAEENNIDIPDGYHQYFPQILNYTTFQKQASVL